MCVQWRQITCWQGCEEWDDAYEAQHLTLGARYILATVITAPKYVLCSKNKACMNTMVCLLKALLYDIYHFGLNILTLEDTKVTHYISL